MKTKELRKMLAERGLEAEEVSIVKNGVPCLGFRIDDGSEICPVVYYSSEETAEQFVERCLQIKTLKKSPIDIERLQDQEYLKEHAFLCVQKQSSESLIKKKYLNLEVYIRIGVEMNAKEEMGSIKPNAHFVNSCGIDEAELWEAATKNTLEKVKIFHVQELLGIHDADAELFPIYVATSNENYGAAAICFPQIFSNFCKEHQTDGCVVIPSSVAEVLLIPDDSLPTDISDLPLLVEQINQTDVAPVLQLEPVVYHFDMTANAFSVVDIER